MNRDSRPSTPPGPSTTTSDSSASTSCSCEDEQTSRVGRPWSRSRRTASKASRSPRSSPANSTPPGVVLGQRGLDRQPLVHAGRPDLEDLPAGLEGEPVPLRRVAQRLLEPHERRPPRRAAGGCAPPGRGPSPRRRRRRRAPPRAAGAARRGSAWSPRGGSGEVNSRVPESQRSLPYCPITTSRAPSASPSATASRPPSSTTWRAGRPVTTTTARTRAASPVRTRGPSGWMTARRGVLDDRRQGAVEVQADEHVTRDGDQPVVPVLGLAGAELHAGNPVREATSSRG